MYTELTIYHNYLENLSVNCQKQNQLTTGKWNAPTEL